MIRIESPNNICRYSLALELIRKVSITQFLEIGIGNGVFLEKIARKGYRGMGKDISEQAVANASVRLKKYPNVKIEKTSFLNLTCQFDLVIMMQVLEHMENDIETILRIKQLITKDGYLLLSVPAHKQKWGYLDLVGGHYRRYERDEIKKTLQDAGFKILYLYSSGFPIANLFRFWEENLYKKYFYQYNLDQKSHEERTKKSGCIEVPGVFGFPPICKVFINEIVLSPFLWLQKLFVNSELGLNYLVLARKNNTNREQQNY